MGAAGMMPSIYASQSDLAERTYHGTAGTEPREHQNFGQSSRKVPAYMYRKRFDSLFLGPAGGNQVLLTTGSSSRGCSDERCQGSQDDSARAAVPILSRADRGTAFAHHEARSPSTSAEPKRRQLVSEGPSPALSLSPLPVPSTHRVFFRSPQMDDNRFRVPENVAHQHDGPLGASPLADDRPDDIRSNSSNGFSFNPTTPLVNRPLYVGPSHASGSQGPIVNPVASPRAHAYGMNDRKGKRKASIQSPDTPYVDSFDWSEIRRSVPSPKTGTIEIGNSLGPPVLSLRPSSPCSHISVASSNDTLSVFSFEVNISAVETPASPGRSAHVASSPPPQPPQPAVSPFAVSTLVEHAIPDLSTQSQEGLNEEDIGDNSQDLQLSPGDTRFGSLGDVGDPASLELTDSSREDLSVLFDDSPTLIRLKSPSKVASTSRASTHLPTQSTRPSGLDTTSPPRVWPLWSPSLPPYVDHDASRSTEVTGLGLSIEGIMSPRSHPPQHRVATRAPPRTPPDRHAGSIGLQNTTGEDTGTSPLDAPASARQAQESPSYPSPRSAMPDPMQQSGGSTNDAAPLNSPSNIPLPSSPTASTTSGSPARLRLQAQPSHRSSPLMPFYPSLTVDRGDDQQQQQQRQRTLLSPSGLDVPLGFASAFGRPTPRLSPIQAPAPAIPGRPPSPSVDPRSPISRLSQIPGSFMRLSRSERVSFLV